ncbi:unnamed protein product [Arabidopsis lyrata]|uniref:uncharacterized protein LOC9303407 n=1 Tax=Arabidopsis lyrata subsp. lyrata TaxID=81972 RepID=UPI000A29BA4E|nr:uncharacterized protein LOC9303407 [Arabidopsis lyrata subsp. lyrata]CAH8274789.1 unnamed protein product [Arabidopsis lyrata]|eukprot:XP_020874482.1 uncharacterized protein LOC9303407 [Arabidopsis lyrata subsp. lyrata]
MRTSSLLGWFLIISLLLLSQSLIISCGRHGTKITPLERGLVEHEENADGSHGHHHDHLRVFVRKSKSKKKKKDKSSATRTLLSNPFTYVSTVVSSFVLLLAAF